MTTALTPAEAPALPTMFGGLSADDIDMGDLMTPQVTLAQGNSDLIKNRVARDGDVVWHYGGANPTLLIDEDNPSFTAYVVAAEKFAATTEDGRMVFHDDKRRDLDDPNSWEGFFYYLAIPELDEYMPARLMLWKTAGKMPSKQLNTLLLNHAGSGNTEPLTVQFKLVPRTGRSGHAYKAFAVSPATPDPEDLAIAERVRVNAYKLIQSRAHENDGPARPQIDQPDVS